MRHLSRRRHQCLGLRLLGFASFNPLGGTIEHMSTAVEYGKKSITVPMDVLDEVNRLLSDGNFSAYVTEALKRQIQRDKLSQLVDELEADYGPVTEEEHQQAFADMTS